MEAVGVPPVGQGDCVALEVVVDEEESVEVGVGVTPPLPPLPPPFQGVGDPVRDTLPGEGEGVEEKDSVGVVLWDGVVVEDREGELEVVEVRVTWRGDKEGVVECEDEGVGLEVEVKSAGLGVELWDRVVERERDAEGVVVEEGEFVREGAPGLLVAEVVGVEEREAGRD